MKKSILAISLISSLALLSTGCGSDSDSKSTTVYDISQYVLPTQSQISNYIKKTYENDKGKKKYSNTPDKEDTYAQRYDVNGTTIKEYNGDVLESTNTIQADKITETDADDNSVINTIRQAKEGENIFTKNDTYQEDGINMIFQSNCKIDDHLTSKDVKGTTYNDILEIVCKNTARSEEGAKAGGLPYEILIENTITSYFAKNKGMVMKIDEICSKAKVNNAVVNNICEKETTEIITIN